MTAPPKHPAELRLERALADGHAWKCKCGTITFRYLPCCHNCGEDQPLDAIERKLELETEVAG